MKLLLAITFLLVVGNFFTTVLIFIHLVEKGKKGGPTDF